MYVVLIIVAAVLLGWPAALLLAVLGLADTGGLLLWPVAIGLGILCYRNRRQRPSVRAPREADPPWSGVLGASRALSLSDTMDLAALRLDLDHRHARGILSAERYAELCAGIDGLWLDELQSVEAGPESEAWCARRARAYVLLSARGLVAGSPPWGEAGRAPAEAIAPDAIPVGTPVEGETPVGEPAIDLSLAPVAAPGSVVGEAAVMVEPEAREPMGDRSSTLPAGEGAGIGIGAWAAHARGTRGDDPGADRRVGVRHALRPAEPGVLERTLKAVSGWHALVVPFLVQNIGWFIGGFCFIAGSVFLVSYTTGLGKAFAIWGAMLLYTLLLIGGGYALRRRRPELSVSSEVLMSLGTLLVPLTIAAATRLIAASPSFGYVLGGLVVALLSLALFYPTLALASGVMDRRLHTHPRLYLALSATQLAIPLLDLWRSSVGIALVHLLILGLLGFALLRYTDEWFQAIFVERRKSAMYAAGTLLYGALVAFVHVTWGAPEDVPLPRGYYGPFLMAASGLLFYVDARLKRRSIGHAFLSRFTFAIYGLSVLALGLASGAPIMRGVTLVLGIGLYGFVVWHYLTLTPLYLLFGSVSWLYALVVLRPFDPVLYLLLTLPGLAGLLALNRSLLARRSARLGEIASRTLGALLCSLLALSLWHGEPGLIAFATGASASLLWYLLIQSRGGAGENRNERTEKLGRYGVMLLCAVTLAYAPRWPALVFATQLGFGLLGLAAFWTRRGLDLLNARRTARAEAMLDSASLAAAVAIPLALHAWSRQGAEAAIPAVVLVIAGALYLRLGLALYLRPFIYAALGCSAAAGIVTKLGYFPAPSAGGSLMLLALLAWIARYALEVAAGKPRESEEPTDPLPVTLLSRFRGFRRGRGWGYHGLLTDPLTQAMVVLWLAGMAHLVMRLVEGRIGWAWVMSAALGAVAGVLFAGRLRRAELVAVASVLGLGAWLAAFYRLGYTTTGSMPAALVAYAAMVWGMCVWFLWQPVALRLAAVLRICGGYGSGGGRFLIERTIHKTSMGFSVVSGMFALGLFSDGGVTPGFGMLPVLLIAAGFWAVSAWRYRPNGQEPGFHEVQDERRFYAYLVLAALSVAVLALYAGMNATPGLAPLAADPGAGVALVSLALGFLVARSWGAGTGSAAQNFYFLPLAHWAMVLTFIAVGQQAYGIGLAGRIEGMTPSLVLALAGVVLLWTGVRRFSMDLTAILLLVLALVCGELAVFHDGLAPARVDPGLVDPPLADLGMTLAIVSLLLSLIADALHRRPDRAPQLGGPLRVAAGLCYGSALLAGLALFGSGSRGGGLAGTLLALAVALPALRWPIPVALLAPVRGLGVALFLSAALGSGPMIERLGAYVPIASLSWAYVLWSLASFGVPRFNARWPRYMLDADTWPWLGLGFIIASVLGAGAGPEGYALRLFAASAYLFLLLGKSAWPGLAFGAVFGLAAAGGLALLALLDYSMPAASVLERVEWLLIGLLVWANVLLRAGHAWRRYGAGIASRLGWEGHDLAAPFTAATWLGFGLGFLALVACVWDALFLPFPGVRSGHAGFVILLSLALALSMGHALGLSRTLRTLQGLMVALAGVWLGGYLMLFPSLVHPPLAVAGFALAVYGAMMTMADPIIRSMSLSSCTLATVLAITAWVVYWNVPFAERLSTLAVLIGLAGGLAVATGQHAWRMAALGMLIVLLHAWPFAFVPVQAVPLFLPWYAVELAALAFGLECLAASGRARFLSSFSRYWPWLAGMAAIECSLHLLVVVEGLAAGSPPLRLAGAWDGIAALTAAMAILWMGLRRVGNLGQSPWTYAAFLWLLAQGLYVRLLLLGLSPVGLWDTTALIVVAYGLVFLQRLFDSRPFLHLAYLMPLAVLLTVPLQLASVPASLGLITAGSVYLLMRQTSGLALYLGVLALNAALYLWIPSLARESGLIQIYLIPACSSVLCLLHLHRHELRPSVLHSTRLGAVTLLYASATADVFLAPGLGVFALALFLSLIGAVLGIALRIRAPLYAGVIFLVVNVLGQLVRFYPDGRLAKAVMLMIVGTSITGVMVWFNLKRERVLRQVRVFRADLAGWD